MARATLTVQPSLMPDDLIFLMGRYEARIPTDRLYSRNHMWLQQYGSVYRVGFTAFSVRLLQDVYFLDWTIDPDTPVREREEIGEIESSKALSTLYAPFAGRIVEFNENLLDDPSAINTDNYGAGWLFTFSTETEPIDPHQYVKLLEEGWDETQRQLKGQVT